MSEQNILNPTANSFLNFDYGYPEGLPEMRSIVQVASGRAFSRRTSTQGRAYLLTWAKRDLATKHALQQWARQYENDFFSLADWERGRYFSGWFDGPILASPAGNNNYTIQARFVEEPGLPMFAYPVNWARDAIFLEERNGRGEDLVKLSGAWTYQVDPQAHGGAHYYSGVPGGTATAEWQYLGYGQRIYSEKGSDRGKVEGTVTRVRDGVIMDGPSIVDLYNSFLLPSAVIFTTTNLPWDEYRVKLRVTGTKNASASDVICTADAIEVMQ